MHQAPNAIVRTKLLLDELAARPLEEQIKHALAHRTYRRAWQSTEGVRRNGGFSMKNVHHGLGTFRNPSQC